MPSPDVTNEVFSRLHGYLMAMQNGELTPEEHDALEALVCNDPAACDLYISYTAATRRLARLVRTRRTRIRRRPPNRQRLFSHDRSPNRFALRGARGRRTLTDARSNHSIDHWPRVPLPRSQPNRLSILIRLAGGVFGGHGHFRNRTGDWRSRACIATVPMLCNKSPLCHLLTALSLPL